MKLTHILISAVLAVSAARAATTLTGMQIHSTDAEGNADAQTPHVWNTKPTNGNMKIFIARGEKDSAFLNGPKVQDAEPNIPLTGGTYTYYIFMERYNAVLKPRYALNLYFNLASEPQITIFAPLNTSSNEYFPDWFTVPAGKRVGTMLGPDAKATGKSEFVDGQTKITVRDYAFSAPNVFKLDRVSYFETKPSEDYDFIGHVTLVVSAPPQISNGGVVNAASFTPRVAPGSLISVFGTDLATERASAQAIPLPKSLAGTSVTIGGKEAPLVFVSPTQINAQVPYELNEGSTATVVVKVNGVSSPERTVQVVKAAPGIFQFGEKRAVVQNADASVNTAENPAEAGSYVVAYLTGCGNVDHAVATGGPAGSDPLSRPKSVVTAKVGDAQAEVAFAGLTPGFIGLMQVNLRVPGVPAGTHPLAVTVDGVQSNTAMISVK